MRTSISLPRDQIEALDEIAKRRGVSRASVIREAVAGLLDREGELDFAFGLWGNRKIDGVQYQRKLRREWSR
jgi:predicted DNA-binding protein